MSYTEYLRRKAATAPKVVDTTVRTDASTMTMRVRLAANNEFALNARQGVINNVSEPSNTGTTSTRKAARMTTKVSGGRIPDASSFTSFVGGQAIDKDGGPFFRPQRYTLNSNTAGSLSGCAPVDEPAPALASGTVLGTVSASTTVLSASGTTLTVGVSPYTVGFRQKNFSPSRITISGATSTIIISGFTAAAGSVTATTASTAGIQNGTVITIPPTGGSASSGNRGVFVITSFVANTSVTYLNASGVTEAATATATFTSPNNGTYNVVSVINPYSVTVSGASVITDLSVTGTTSLTLVATGNSANTVPQYASQTAMAAQACRYASTEPHIQSELGPSLFVGDTIAPNRSIGVTSTYVTDTNGTYLGINRVDNTANSVNNCDRVIHTHPADVAHNDRWAPRPAHGMGGIPVFAVPNPSDARKVGAYDYKSRQRYVEKHHGNDQNVNPRRVPTAFVPTNGAPAQLKINDPRNYPVA
jgi:hypothetical protein